MKKLIILLFFTVVMVAGEATRNELQAQVATGNVLNLWGRQNLTEEDETVEFDLKYRYTVNYLIAEDIDLDSSATFRVYSVTESDYSEVTGRPTDYTSPDVLTFTISAGESGQSAKKWLLMDMLIGNCVIEYVGGTGSFSVRIISANLLK